MTSLKKKLDENRHRTKHSVYPVDDEMLMVFEIRDLSPSERDEAEDAGTNIEQERRDVSVETDSGAARRILIDYGAPTLYAYPLQDEESIQDVKRRGLDEDRLEAQDWWTGSPEDLDRIGGSIYVDLANDIDEFSQLDETTFRGV